MAREGLAAAAPNAEHVPRKPRDFSDAQLAALAAAGEAQRVFERARLDYERASDERAAALRAALDAGLSYGGLADAFGWSRSTAQAAAAGRSRPR